jgi:hypothetical protein
MFRPLRGVQNHITLTIDSANLRWLLAALDDLPSSRRMMGFSPRRCSFIPHRNTAACWMLMLNSLCFPSEFFFQASGTSGSARSCSRRGIGHRNSQELRLSQPLCTPTGHGSVGVNYLSTGQLYDCSIILHQRSESVKSA